MHERLLLEQPVGGALEQTGRSGGLRRRRRHGWPFGGRRGDAEGALGLGVLLRQRGAAQKKGGDGQGYGFQQDTHRHGAAHSTDIVLAKLTPTPEMAASDSPSAETLD